MDLPGSFPPVMLVLFMVVLVILWALLPFAVFGIKDLIRDVVDEQKKTNKLLEQIAAQNQPTNPVYERPQPDYSK